jgi:putative flippase GtrA
MTDPTETAGPGAGRRYPGRRAGRRYSPLVLRFAGYGLGSVVAAATSEIAFVVVYAWAHGGTLGASAAGFVGGAIPNYILNRRWAWRDRTGRSRGSEITLYAAVALASFGASVVATRWAEHWARHLTADATWRVLLIAGAYLATSGVFFLAKFVLYDLIVFTAGPADSAAAAAAAAEPAPAATTTS